MGDTEKFLELERGNSEKAMGDTYRRVFFGTHEGVEVLDDILRECRYYDTLPTDNPAVIAMHNVAKVILSKMGLVESGNTVEVLKTMFRLSAVQTIKKED